MNREQFLSELCAFYKHTRAVKKLHCYRVVGAKVVPVGNYSFIESKGGARFLVKWAAKGSKQHQWCCLNQNAVDLCRVWCDLHEEIKPCGLISYTEWLELKASSHSVAEAVNGSPAQEEAK